MPRQNAPGGPGTCLDWWSHPRWLARHDAAPLAERKGLKLVTHVPSEVMTICADEEKVKRVLSHLLANAVKFTPPGGLVEASAHVMNGAVELVVADTGIGIAPEDHPRIFEAFQQLSSTAALQDKGRGLGLTQARRLVELLGGQIWVESTLGAGTTVCVALPSRESEVQRSLAVA